MATFTQGILGPFSGTVGTVVGSICHGKYILRARPNPKKNRTFSAAQIKSQKRLVATTAVLKYFAYLINAGFLNPKTHAFAAAVKANYKHTSTDDEPKLDLAELTLSDGSTPFSTTVAKTASSANFSWTAPLDGDDFFGGRLYMAAYNVANAKGCSASADLANQSGSIDFASLLTGTDSDDVHIYFFAANSAESSPTTHLNA